MADVLARLVADGLLRREGARLRTTRRWQGAMARAAFQLYGAGDASFDLRVPVASALVELYGEELDDAVLAAMVDALIPIEAAELDPRPA